MRGATLNPSNRYHALHLEAVDDGWDPADEALEPLRTRVTVDAARSIIARNTSPDVPFEASINPYRGCEHGCVYCFARPTHAYLDLSPGLDFESRLFVKKQAPDLLRRELGRVGYRCKPITLGANTDAYQPIERHWQVTRGILEDEIARANRYGYPLTLAVMDLDEFKHMNDTYGHAIGDKVLQEYAASILSIFRRLDMVARYGGEEFAVLLPNTDLHGAMRALHKVKSRVPDVTVQTEVGTLTVPTFSAGVSAYHPGETSEAFVSRTDAALYEAKRRGRNRVEAADEERLHDSEDALRHHNDL